MPSKIYCASAQLLYILTNWSSIIRDAAVKQACLRTATKSSLKHRRKVGSSLGVIILSWPMKISASTRQAVGPSSSFVLLRYCVLRENWIQTLWCVCWVEIVTSAHCASRWPHPFYSEPALQRDERQSSSRSTSCISVCCKDPALKAIPVFSTIIREIRYEYSCLKCAEELHYDTLFSGLLSCAMLVQAWTRVLQLALFNSSARRERTSVWIGYTMQRFE